MEKDILKQEVYAEISTESNKNFRMRVKIIPQDMENLKKDKEVDGGYFILITNYKGFWDKSEGKKTKDREFRFANGIKQGEKKWSEDTGGTKKGREKGISIKYSYSVSFESFSDIKSANGNTKFKVLIVKVK